MHKNNYVKLYTVYEFFKFKNSTITRKLSTNIQLEQRIYLHDLKERVPIFSIYKQNIGKTTQISTKKKKVNFRGNFIRKSDRSYNKQCSKQREEENLF